MMGKFLLPQIVERSSTRVSLYNATAMAGCVAAVLFCVFLGVCTGHEPSCNVTWDGNQANYSVSLLVPENMILDSYSWVSNNTVFAANTGKIDPVKSSTDDTLIASKCIPDIVLQKEYLKDGTVHEFTANCNTSCEVVNLNQVQDKPPNSWIEVGIPVGVGVVVLAVLVGCIYRKYRRTCCSSQTGGFFTAVKVI